MKANTKRSKSKSAQSTVTKLRAARSAVSKLLVALEESRSETQREKAEKVGERNDAWQLQETLKKRLVDVEREHAKARSELNELGNEAIVARNDATDLAGRLSTMTFERSEARTAHRFVCGQLAIALRERNEARAALVKTIGVAAFPQPPVTAASPEASS